MAGTFDTILILVGAFIALFLLILLINSIKILKHWERAPVLRLGTFVGVRGPGITFIIPGLEKVPQVISTRLQTYTFRSEQTLTKDNVSVTIDAVMYFKVIDVEKAILEVERFGSTTQWAAQTTLREVIGQVELDELLAERDNVATRLQAIIDEKTEHWGVKVTAVEVRDVMIPPRLQEAISRQAEAERERRARITLAQAEKEAAQGMLDAAIKYDTSATAMELRWINLLFEAASNSRSTIILVPANIPIAGMGTFGLVPLNKVKKEQE